ALPIFRNFLPAVSRSNQEARSTSGNSWLLPVCGGHSIENVLLRIALASISPSTAQAYTILPPACLTGSSACSLPLSGNPVSSSNSRFATSTGSWPRANSPLGMDHAPSSFLAQNGPPGDRKSVV